MSETLIAVVGGEARSGKGTSADALQLTLEGFGQEVVKIDQGQKFRLLAELAITGAQPMDDVTALRDFIALPKTHEDMMRLRGELDGMTEDEVRNFLYRPAISSGSGQIGKVPNAHEVAIRLLRSEVTEAVHGGANTVIIDGRIMEKYARMFQAEGLGTFVAGWYFRCHADIAARRSLGMYVDHANMTQDERNRLLTEIIRISERNRSDAMRDTDPMAEPVRAFHLDLARPTHDETHHSYAKRALQNDRMVVVDTSYTRNVQEMLVPVVGLTMNALKISGGAGLESSPIHYATSNLPAKYRPRS